MTNKTLAFEIGTEELPAFDLHDVSEKLPTLAKNIFDEAKIPYGALSVYSTPRRLILIVSDLAAHTEASVEEHRGPAAKIAFDSDGNPTKAAIGFARGKGIDPEQLELRDEKGTDYVWAVIQTPKRDVAALLPDLLTEIIRAICWPKSQRWERYSEEFARPVRWLLALFGDTVVPVEYAGLIADRKTGGHRCLSPGMHEVATADSLIDTLKDLRVIPSEAEREKLIREQIDVIQKETKLTADLPKHTLEEVINLCEYPTVLVGEFDKKFLEVPTEIIIDAMLMHQRYFPLFERDGALSNKFLITSNGDPDYKQNIIDGNQRVVAARLYDAQFFYEEDLRHPLEFYVDKLNSVVFQESLGTTFQKTHRIVSLAEIIAGANNLSPKELEDAKRAALLCKADLVTQAVVEFTSVQGIMGRYYALASGENEDVAQAISEHYRPRFSGDKVPETMVAKVVAIADKIDSICGLFAIGQGPSGSSDPFALRRAALGILAIVNKGMVFNLGELIAQSLDLYAQNGLKFNLKQSKSDIEQFFIMRTKYILRDLGIDPDVIEAVLAGGVVEPTIIIERCQALAQARSQHAESFDDLVTAFARANNLRDPKLGLKLDVNLLSDNGKHVEEAIASSRVSVQKSLEAKDYASALTQLAQLREPIDNFFESEKVMDDDERIRNNNLRLLNNFIDVFASVADFGKMAKTK